MTRLTKNKRFSLICLGLALLGLAAAYAWRSDVFSGKPPIHLAVAVDNPDPNGSGWTIAQAVRLFAGEINRKGGIDGAKIVVDVYDDEGRPDRARAVAEHIAEKNQAVAVIGHRLSGQSRAAGPIYQRHGIPAVTPASTATGITEKNPWYFRTVYTNNFLGRFLAHYVQAVLDPEGIVVVFGPTDYEKNLAEEFEKTASSLGLPLAGRFLLGEKGSGPGAVSTDEIVEAVERIPGRRCLLMCLYPDRAFDMTVAVRDHETRVDLLAPDTIDKPDFPRMFRHLEKEIRSPGFYTDGVMVGTPLVYDTANRGAGIFRDLFIQTFQASPDWRAAFAYDAAGVVIEALRRGRLAGRGLPLDQIREGIRKELQAMDSLGTDWEGITGVNYFDRFGDASKPVAVGQYQSHLLVSALTQFRTAQSISSRADLETMMAEGALIEVSGQLMERTRIVYSGFNIENISDINPTKNTANIQGEIWFRYELPDESEIVDDEKDPEAPHRIVFINAEGIPTYTPATPMIRLFGACYRRFGFKGTFNLDFIPALRVYQQPTAGLEFRHAGLPSGRLVYVTDMLGMGLDRATQFQDTLTGLDEQLEAMDWQIVRGAFYQSTQMVSTLGRPEYLNAQDRGLTFSTLVAALQLRPASLNLSDLVPDTWTSPLLFLAVLLLIGATAVALARENLSRSSLILLTQFLMMAILIFLGRKALLIEYQDDLPFYYLDVLDKGFAVLWWFFPAFFVTVAIERFIWRPIEERTERKVPNIMRRSVTIVIFLFAAFGVVAFVFKQPLTSLLATSGLITLIIGLAIQANISNIFSGLVLNLERPFTIGDMVKIGSLPPAKVVDMTWRTTRLLTHHQYLFNIPNTEAAESTIQNYSKSQPTLDFISVYVSPRYDPQKVTSSIEKALNHCQLILQDRDKGVLFSGEKLLEDSVVLEFWPWYHLADYHQRLVVRDEVWNQIWRHLDQEGIHMSINPD